MKRNKKAGNTSENSNSKKYVRKSESIYLKVDRKPVFRIKNNMKRGDPMSSNIFNCMI